jgi:hypothetical protein
MTNPAEPAIHAVKKRKAKKQTSSKKDSQSCVERRHTTRCCQTVSEGHSFIGHLCGVNDLDGWA